MMHGAKIFSTTLSTRPLAKLVRLQLIVLLLIGLGACANLNNLNAQLDDTKFSTIGFTYELDRSRTEVKFSVGQINGKFEVFDAQLSFPKPTIEAGLLEMSIVTASVNVFNPLIEQTLKGENWFDVKQYPLATFKTISIAEGVATSTEGTGISYLVKGQLKIKEISEVIELAVHFPDGAPALFSEPEPHPQQPFIGDIEFNATGTFSRGAYGMTNLPNFAPDEVTISVTGVLRQPSNTFVENSPAAEI